MKKRIISAALAASVMLSAAVLPNSDIINSKFDASITAEAATTIVADGIYYSTIDSTYAKITGCNSELTKVVIPSKVNGYIVSSIDDKAFRYSTAIKSVTIPDSVTSIGDEAFAFCTGLEEISIPDSVTSIGENAFKDCEKLKSIKLPDGISIVSKNTFLNCKSLTRVTIPLNVTDINEGAFQNCQSLERVIVPKNVTYIGRHSFSGCKKLQSVTLPSNLGTLSEYAFSGCESLKSISLPDNIGSLYQYVFKNCVSLTSVTIPKRVAYISGDAFSGCKNITSYKVNSENTYYTAVDGVVFNKEKYRLFLYPAGKTNTSYNVPDGVKAIEYAAFADARNLKSIKLPGSVMYIYSRAFSGCSNLKTINIPSYVNSLASLLFESCWSLESITVPGTVKSLESGVFQNCSALKNVTISNGVQSIGSYAFANCASLKNIQLPNSVETLDDTAFMNCRSLETAVLGKNINQDSYYYYGGVSPLFVYCPKFRKIFCYADSYAYKFARNNGYDYEILKELSTPTVTVSTGASGVNVKWNKVKNASGYIVYRKSGSGNWTKIATISGGSTVSYTDKTAKSGTTYKYTVRATANAGRSQSEFKSSSSIKFLSTPAVKAANVNSGVKVSWNKVTGAGGYIVYRKSGSGDWTRIKEISSGSTVSYVDTEAKAGSSYYYTVRAVSGSTKSSFKGTLAIKRLTTPTVSVAKASNGIKVSWNKPTGSEGYVVYRRTADQDWASIKVITSGDTKSYVDTTAKSGTTYYYTVRATSGGSKSDFKSSSSIKK